MCWGVGSHVASLGACPPLDPITRIAMSKGFRDLLPNLRSDIDWSSLSLQCIIPPPEGGLWLLLRSHLFWNLRLFSDSWTGIKSTGGSASSLPWGHSTTRTAFSDDHGANPILHAILCPPLPLGAVLAPNVDLYLPPSMDEHKDRSTLWPPPLPGTRLL